MQSPCSSSDHEQCKPDLSRCAVVVLGTADVQHALAKLDKNIAQQERFLQKHESAGKKPRTYLTRERLRDFWIASKKQLCEEFAAEVAAHCDPYRLEQCEKKRLARKNKKRKVEDVPNSVSEMVEEEGEVEESPLDKRLARLRKN